MAKVICLRIHYVLSAEIDFISQPTLWNAHKLIAHSLSFHPSEAECTLPLSFVRHLLLLLLLGVGVVESALVAKRASESREKRKIHPSIRPHPHQGRFWIKTGPEWKKETHQGVCMRWWREERTAAAIPPPRLRWAALKLAFVLTSLAH